ncbi:MAG: TMEM165/GDT1 family protein [Ilumatobacteraceae bacterium]
MLQHAVITYFVIALAELPDKTMLATLMLSSKYKNRLAVWCGVTLGYATHVVIAVLFGAILTTLPREPIHVLVGLLFITGGVLTLRKHNDNDDAELDRPATTLNSTRIIWLAASVILVAEFADLTQLATAGLAVRFNDPFPVAIGAILALSSVSGIGVLIGSWIQRHVPLRIVQRVAGVLFVVIGGSTLVAAVF